MVSVRDIEVKAFRGIRELRLAEGNIGRINFIVGRNNSCKSSLLEALALAASNSADLQELFLPTMKFNRPMLPSANLNSLMPRKAFTSISLTLTTKNLAEQGSSIRRVALFRQPPTLSSPLPWRHTRPSLSQPLRGRPALRQHLPTIVRGLEADRRPRPAA